MKQTLIAMQAWWYAGFVCMLLVSGCGKTTDRLSLEGSVTLDGQPLAEGSIAFLPKQGTKGPASGGRINHGTFSVSPNKGVFEGKFRVEIIASRKTGRKEKDPLGNLVDEYGQYLPERYNRQSELTAKVTEAGPNQFDFALSSP